MNAKNKQTLQLINRFPADDLLSIQKRVIEVDCGQRNDVVDVTGV